GVCVVGARADINLVEYKFFKTTEVRNHRADDELASKFVAVKLSRAEHRPKAFFRFALLPPKLTCSISQRFDTWVSWHVLPEKPSPLPSPTGRGNKQAIRIRITVSLVQSKIGNRKSKIH